MNKTFIKFILLSVFALALTSCKTTAHALLFTESTIPPQDVKGKTVAILPNRLPVSMQDPEKWRTKNYEVMRVLLEKEGFAVVDYNTSNQLFQQSGLPLEDTKASRDKYADLAQKLNADLLVFPYYGITFNSTGFSNAYISTGSLQFYSLKHNDFCARIDLEGQRKIQTWPQLALPLIGTAVSAIIAAASSSTTSSGSSSGSGVASVISVLSTVATFGYSIIGFVEGKTGHEKAFKKAFGEAFELYFSTFPTPNRSYSPNNNNNYGNNNNNNGNSGNNGSNNNSNSGSKYAKYSIEDLEILKKSAVTNSDFKTAGEIKEEIEKRRK